MRMILPAAAAAVLAAFAAPGCGSSGDDSTQATSSAASTAETTAAATTTAAKSAVTIKMTEFAFTPQDVTAKAGKVTITAPNDGDVVHELVLLKTDADPAKLPLKNGAVDESTSVGEIADVEPGATKKITLKLASGSYAMVCALPGHYQGGMYGSLTVK